MQEEPEQLALFSRNTSYMEGLNNLVLLEALLDQVDFYAPREPDRESWSDWGTLMAATQLAHETIDQIV